MSENWKHIDGFDNYEVSDCGNVRNKTTNKILKPYDSVGRMSVTLYINGKGYGKRLHNLVANAFVPNPDHKEFVYNANLDVRNCRADNLYWISSLDCDKLSFQHMHRKAMLQELKGCCSYLKHQPVSEGGISKGPYMRRRLF